MPCHRKKYFPFGRTPSIPIYSDRKGAVVPKRSPFPRWMRAPCIMRVIARPERGVFSAPPPVAAEAAQASLENRLKTHYLPDLCPSCARADTPLPPPARARIVLLRAAPRCAAARPPRTGSCGRRRRSDRPFRTGFSRWLGGKRRLSPKPPSFKSSLNPFHFNFEVLLWTESSILAQDERWRRA